MFSKRYIGRYKMERKIDRGWKNAQLHRFFASFSWKHTEKIKRWVRGTKKKEWGKNKSENHTNNIFRNFLPGPFVIYFWYPANTILLVPSSLSLVHAETILKPIWPGASLIFACVNTSFVGNSIFCERRLTKDFVQGFCYHLKTVK